MQPTHTKKRILVIDHELPSAYQINNLINLQPDLATCNYASGTMPLAAVITLHKPDLLLLGTTHHDGEVFELTNTLRLEFPEIPILLSSNGDETLYAERALQAGARGYIMNNEGAGELLRALRTVLSGRIHLSRSMSVRVVQRVLKPGASDSTQEPA